MSNLIVIGFIEREILIFKSILAWILWKKLIPPPLSAILQDFYQEYQFTTPIYKVSIYSSQKNENNKNSTGNYKALCVSGNNRMNAG